MYQHIINMCVCARSVYMSKVQSKQSGNCQFRLTLQDDSHCSLYYWIHLWTVNSIVVKGPGFRTSLKWLETMVRSAPGWLPSRYHPSYTQFPMIKGLENPLELFFPEDCWSEFSFISASVSFQQVFLWDPRKIRWPANNKTTKVVWLGVQPSKITEQTFGLGP